MLSPRREKGSGARGQSGEHLTLVLCDGLDEKTRFSGAGEECRSCLSLGNQGGLHGRRDRGIGRIAPLEREEIEIPGAAEIASRWAKSDSRKSNLEEIVLITPSVWDSSGSA